jgi:tetratricopeptide (TPR) repeat protein
MIVPDQFGLFAKAALLMSVAGLFREIGQSGALVAYQGKDPRYIYFNFQLNSALGLCAAVLVFASLSAPRLIPDDLRGYIWLPAVIPLFDSLTLTNSLMLQKQLRFKVLGLVEIFTLVAWLITVCLTVGRVPGLLVLLCSAFVESACRCLLLFVVAGGQFVGFASGKDLRHYYFYTFARPVIPLVILQNLLMRSDFLLLTFLSTTRELGTYERLGQFSRIPISLTVNLCDKVLMRSYSHFQNDRAALKRLLKKSMLLITFGVIVITAVVTVLLFILPEFLVGSDWTAIVKNLCLIAGLLLLGFLITHFLSAWKFVRWRLQALQQNEKALSSSLALVVGAAAGIAALAVHSIFDFNLQIPGNTLFAAFLFGILANPEISRVRPVIKARDYARSFETPRAPSGKSGAFRLRQTNADTRLKTFGYVGQAWHGNGPGFLTWIWKVIPVALSIILIGSILPRWASQSEAEASRRAFLDSSYALTIYHAKRAAEYGNEEPDLFYYLGESRRLLANRFDGTTRLNFLGSAVEAFDQGLKYFPMNERSLVKCGLTQAELGDFQKADIYFNQAFRWDPNLGQIYAFYGARLQLEGRDKDADAAYQRSDELSVSQIAIVGQQQVRESMKRKETGLTRPD